MALGATESIRIGRIVRLFADRREPVEAAEAGDVVALLGTDLATGQTLSARDDRMLLEPIRAPQSVMRLAIEPRTRTDRERLPQALARMRLEDPSLRVAQDADTGQTTLAGMGQLHLEVSLSRLETAHRVAVRAGTPKVAYRETITISSETSYLHKKQNGGKGEWARVSLRLEPAERGSGLTFVDAIRAGAISKPYIPAVFAGCREAAERGAVAGYPVVDVRVVLFDGAMHSDESSEMAFSKAGRAAFAEALKEAGPQLLEPLMRVEVEVAGSHLGDIVGDLARRRGRVLELSAVSATIQRIVAEAPLAQLFGYANELSEPESWSRIAPVGVVALCDCRLDHRGALGPVRGRRDFPRSGHVQSGPPVITTRPSTIEQPCPGRSGAQPQSRQSPGKLRHTGAESTAPHPNSHACDLVQKPVPHAGPTSHAHMAIGPGSQIPSVQRIAFPQHGSPHSRSSEAHGVPNAGAVSTGQTSRTGGHSAVSQSAGVHSPPKQSYGGQLGSPASGQHCPHRAPSSMQRSPVLGSRPTETRRVGLPRRCSSMHRRCTRTR